MLFGNAHIEESFRKALCKFDETGALVSSLSVGDTYVPGEEIEIIEEQSVEAHLDEWLEAIDWIAASGRYDGLVELLGGKPTPAIGFAMGLERLIELSRERLDREPDVDADVYVIVTNDRYTATALGIAESVRDARRHRRVMCHCGGGSMKSQMKKADRSGARVAMIIGDDEFENGTVTIKPLRDKSEQRTVPRTEGLRCTG